MSKSELGSIDFSAPINNAGGMVDAMRVKTPSSKAGSLTADDRNFLHGLMQATRDDLTDPAKCRAFGTALRALIRGL